MENPSINVSELDISDFLTPCEETSYNNNNNNNYNKHEKSRRYRQQMEYGAKKYIKP